VVILFSYDQSTTYAHTQTRLSTSTPQAYGLSKVARLQRFVHLGVLRRIAASLSISLFFAGFALTFSSSIRLSLIARQADGQRSVDGPKTISRSNPSVNPVLEEHLDVVFRYALRLTKNHQQAEDLTQDTMLRAWRKINALREPQAAKVWLLRIATNLWTDHLRRQTERPRLLVDPPPDRQPTTATKLIQRESVAAALAALDNLPDRQRQVMHLITVEQLSQQETADVLGISAAAVKASLSMGRKQLREQLRDLYEEVCGAKR